jgi:ribonuclease P protein component
VLNKLHRLSTKNVTWLLKKGFNFSNECFSVKFHLNKSPHSRYSIVVSKKISALATDRNRLRRQFYEILRTSPERLPPADYVIMIRNKAARLTSQEKRDLLDSTLRQITSKLK